MTVNSEHRCGDRRQDAASLRCAKCVGRVGALAVALGIGMAVTNTPAVTGADSSESDSSSSPTASDSSPTAPSSGTTSSSGSQSTSSDSVDYEPTWTVDATGGAHISTTSDIGASSCE